MIVAITQYTIGINGDYTRPWDGAKAGHCFTTFISSVNYDDTRPKMKTLANANYNCEYETWVESQFNEHLNTFRLEFVY